MRHRWVVFVGCLIAAVQARGQVAVAKLAITAGSASYTGWVGYVDLPKGGFAPFTRGSACTTCKNYPAVTLLDTMTFAKSQPAMLVAITANCGLGLSSFKNNACETTVDGLIVANGALVNPPQYQGPALYFTSNTNAAITSGTLPSVSTITWAVAGSTSTDNDCSCGQLGTLLVEGHQPGACPIPKSKIPAARGAAGVTANGVLILAIVQGAEGSSGMTTAQFARLLIDLGAQNAVNFDGGGSTAFIWNLNKLPVTEEASLHNLVTNGGGFTITPAWQAVTGSYFSDPACDGCTNFRPVYANLGILYTGANAVPAAGLEPASAGF